MSKPQIFKPGVSGNPNWRPKVPEDLSAIKNISADEIKRTIAKYLRKTINDIKNIKEDDDFFGNLKALDGLVVSVIKNALDDPKGDVNRLEFLLQRSGVPLKVEYDDSDEMDAVFDEIPQSALLSVVKNINNLKENVHASEAVLKQKDDPG